MNEDSLPQHPGLRSLAAASEESIDYINWHRVSAAIEGVLDNLSHRSIEELFAAIKQLEEILPELSGEIGATKEVLDFPPVGPIKKFAAMILTSYFSEFKRIVDRAEQREEAEARLKNLERVQNQLTELREKLGHKIDEMLEMKLHDTDPEAYEECQEIRKSETFLKSHLARLEVLRGQTNIEDMKEKYWIINARNTPPSSSFITWYEEMSGNPIGPDTLFITGVGIAEKIKEEETVMLRELADLTRRRAAILEPLFHKYSNPQQ